MHERHQSWTRVLLRWGIVACATVVVSGCYKATFIQPKTAAGVEHDEWTDFFLFGLVGEEQGNISSYCDDQVARVRTGGNVGTGVVSVVTLGIYTPRKIYVTCADPAATKALEPTASKEAVP